LPIALEHIAAIAELPFHHVIRSIAFLVAQAMIEELKNRLIGRRVRELV
jgi:hypothetical protein